MESSAELSLNANGLLESLGNNLCVGTGVFTLWHTYIDSPLKVE